MKHKLFSNVICINSFALFATIQEDTMATMRLNIII